MKLIAARAGQAPCQRHAGWSDHAPVWVELAEDCSVRATNAGSDLENLAFVAASQNGLRHEEGRVLQEIAIAGQGSYSAEAEKLTARLAGRLIGEVAETNVLA